jgi:signal peptidase I
MSLSQQFFRRGVIAMRALAMGVFLLALVRVSLFTVYRVSGTSMMDTLLDGDRILVLDGDWFPGDVQNGDTVVLTVDGEVLVKRVMGCPGDALSMVSGRVLRNGIAVDEDIPRNYRRQSSMSEHRLAGNEYFVMGDHRRVSVDSRDFGPVGGQQILGRVVLRLEGTSLRIVSALEDLGVAEQG